MELWKISSEILVVEFRERYWYNFTATSVSCLKTHLWQHVLKISLRPTCQRKFLQKRDLRPKIGKHRRADGKEIVQI